MSQLFSGKDNFYSRFRIILNIGFSPKASGFYPLNLCFNRNRKIFNILRQKPQEGVLLIECTLLLYLEESDFYRYF